MEKHIRANVVILVSIPIIIIVTAIFIWALRTNARIVEKNVQLTKEVQTLKAEVEKNVQLTKVVQTLTEEGKTLKAEIDRLKNEPQILFSKANDEKKANKHDSALAILKDIQQRYPDFQPDKVSAAIEDFTLAKANFLKEQEEKKRIQELDNERVAREREKAIEETMNNLVNKRDEMEDIDWYHDKSPLVGPRYIDAYIGKKNGNVWLRFKMVFVGDDWLFVKSVLFKVDGEDFKLTYGFFDDWERDNNSSCTREWKDVLVDKYIWNLINKIAKSEKTMMRYEGQQKRFDRDISTTEKLVLKNIILGYEAMGGKPPTE
jgi:cell division protein FtsB